MNTNQIDSTWENDFVVELRLLDVNGKHIGEALEQVRSHCADSGEDARETFGDPVAYARSLELPTGTGSPWRMLLSTAGGLVGMFLSWWSFSAWLDGQQFGLTVGQVVVALVMVLLAPLLLRHLRTVVEHPWLAIPLAVVVLLAAVAAPVLLTGVVVRLPALAMTGIGVALVVGTAVWDHRRAGDADPVLSPVPAAVERPGRTATLLGVWLMPLGTLLLLVLAWVLDSLA